MTGKFPHVCFDRFLDSNEEQMVARGAQRMALLESKRWETRAEIPVGFAVGATGQQKREAQQAFEEWEKFANVNFKFGTSQQKVIKVSFDPRGGAWSMLGTDAIRTSNQTATMNLGFNQAGTYLHEVGHALGLIHEHQNPEGGMQWNREAVIRALSGPPNNWDRQTIENNMFRKYSRNQINGTQLDPRSIMMYAFPASWTTNGFGTKQNAVLSETDKSHIAKLYPGRFEPAPIDTDPISPKKSNWFWEFVADLIRAWRDAK